MERLVQLGRSLPWTAIRLLLWTIVATNLAPDVLHDPYRLVDFHDEFYFYSHEQGARRTIVDYAEIPFWDPYHCGGIVGIANPQDTSLGPDFLLRIVFGTAPGRRLAVLLFFVLAMEGLFLLARRHRASVSAAFVGAVVFGVTGRLENAVEHGQLNLLLYALTPWALYFFERGMSQRGYAAATGVVVAWMLLCGGTYTAPYTVQVLLVATLYWSLRIAFFSDPTTRRLSFWSPWLVLIIAGAVSFGSSAIRLFPMTQLVLGIPREVLELQIAGPEQMANALFLPSSAGQQGDAYVGLTIAGLAALALLSTDRSGRYFGLAALFFFALGLGQRGTYSPYELFRHLPLFDQLRDPYRYTVIVAMFLCLGATRGFTLLEQAPAWLLELRRRRLRREPFPPTTLRLARVLGWMLVCALVYFVGSDELIASQTIEVGRLFVEPGVSMSHQRFRQSRGNRWDNHIWPSINLGALGCFEETKFHESTQLRADLRAEEYPLDPQIASVRRVHWSPTEIELAVRAAAPTRVIVNQNYHPGWDASVGTVVSHRGLLAVDLPRGRHSLVLSFDDTAATIGTIVSVCSWLALLAFAIVLALRRVRRGLSAWRALPP
jgi:hypothetical protein